jgi:iron complex outermembrane receptor protein
MKAKAVWLAATILSAPGAALAQQAAAAPGADQLAQAGAQGGQRSGAALEEIVVTAERREENLQRVPVSVTAFSGDVLLERGTVRLEQLQSAVPGLTMNTGVNNKSTLTVVLRGLGEGGGGFASTESPVAFYVDDVFQGRLSGTNAQFSDIERIEVLRGPQGTLFGRNAQSGAVNIISRTPGDDLYGNLSLGYGNYDTIMSRGAIGGPIGGTPLSASVAFVYRDQNDGFKRNVVLNRDVDKEEATGFRGKLRYRGGDRFDATLAVSNTVNKGAFEPVAVSLTTLRPLTGSYYITQSPFESVGRTEITNVNFRFTYDFGGVELKSISAWQKLEDAFRWDLSGGFRQGGTIVPGFDRNSNTDQQQWTQEVQLSGSAFDERFNWIVGGFYYTENVQQRLADAVTPALFFVPVPGQDRPLTIFSSNNESWAGFVQGSYDLTDRLTLTAGLRYTTEDKRVNGARRPLLAPITVPFRNQTSYNAWTPRFSLEYEVNEAVFLFASAARGFRPGGYSVGGATAAGISTPYGPESVWSYEAGTKLDLFDNRVRVNATTFLAQYESLQAAFLQAGPGIGVLIRNGYDLDVWGVELEAQAVLVDGVTASLTLGLQDQKFRNVLAGTDLAGFIARNPNTVTPGFPDYTGSIALNVDKPLADFGIATPGNVLFGVDLTFRDVTYASPDNQPIAKNPVQRRLNGYIGYATEDGRWRATFSMRNITDAVDWLNGLPLVQQGTRGPLEPRTYMFEIAYKY